LDANVLAAQQWVNATYTGVPGYNRIAEDGSAGWQTMYALTRALQHELGITALSDNFGPATLSALTAHGPIGPGETNRNLVKIVECAAFCKGYHPGGITGVFGTQVAAAVAALMTDAGLAERIDGKVAPKVCKSMLRMDGYTLVAGGSPHLRAAQRWMNNRYLNRSAFFVLPCDGKGGRDFLKALIFAVQYEGGLTDAQANGSFGPLTQAGVKSKGLIRTGSTGAWVQVFSAALTLYPAAQRFTDTFDEALAGDVRTLQRFCQLEATGAGDFPTWASLLISTGDQARPATAADTIDEVTAARAQTLRAGGYITIGRYLTNTEGSSFDKKIKPGELATMAANGLSLFPIYQTYSDSASYFSWSQGYTDALAAHDAALGHGIDAGAVIYFAVDYDATDADVDQRVTPHFLGIEAGLRARGRRYAHGVYGARNICSRLAREAFPRWSFVSGITSGWTGNMGYPLPDNWAFDQIATIDIGSGGGGIEIDKCVHRLGTDAGESRVNSPATPLSSYLDWIERLQELAVAYGQGAPAERVLEYLRAGRYDNWQNRQLSGGTDEAFLAYVDARGLPRLRTYRDPVAGVDVDVSRFGAACLAAVRGEQASTPGRADFGGWGGDWIAFYGGWRFTEPATPGRGYCAARLAMPGVTGAFDTAGLVSDVDAYHAAAALRAGGDLAAHLRAADRGTRHGRFYRARFGSDPTTAATAAQAMLTTTADANLTAARALLLRGLAPSPVVVDDQLRDLCRGFADRLTALTEAEQATTTRREVR
jgi:peptidoglycan hydrolase-like protein with peptidoglycan-binding domain